MTAISTMKMNVSFEADEEGQGAALFDLYSGVSVAIVRVTPALAHLWLKKNTKNRPLDVRHVNHLKQSFIDGDMMLNGETIIFDSQGRLLNGQHRLHACEDSGCFFDALVVSGIESEAFKTLDAGKRRSSGDYLSMQGEVNTRNLASAVQSLLSFVDFGGSVGTTTAHGRRATPQACERVLKEYPQLRASVQVMRRAKLYDNQNGYLLHFLFSLVDADIASDFCEVMANGSNDTRRPFVRLRETIITNGGRNDFRRQYAAKAVKAFNAERSGDRPKLFKFGEGESFPRVDGLDYESLALSLS